MKKWFGSILILLFTLTLAACGSENADVNEIYKNAVEAAEDMKSAEFVIDLTQDMKLASQGMEMTMDSKMEGSMIVEPMAMHQKGTMNVMMAGESMEMDMEMYMVDDEVYMYDSESAAWMKMDAGMVPQITGEQPDVNEQLEMMEPYIEDFKQEEKDGNYVLRFTADGDGVKELTKELMSQYMNQDVTAQLGDITEVLDNTEISDVSISMYIDKESYQLRKYDMDMDMKMNIEGEELELAQQATMEYTSINKVEKIEVPQEVKDSSM
ncbi:DUF6612 family protein [Salirhabdus sp. Marseille-P4669]|uniref:DUF6612 family protein n=1 Tax=Salirhabdus sp. Marseille-P4669 TaxID=2042310 RepID=UPI000C7A22CA|nr:DUF6612 family protein [Salirhabdus sp. Marseille-P4669]